MSLKKMGALVMAVFAFGAVFASSAFAEPAETPTTLEWYTGSTEAGVTTLPAGSANAKAATCAIGEHPAGTKTATLVSNVKGTVVEVQATGVTCPGGKIENEVSGTTKMAIGSATSINFTGVSVKKPTTCSTSTTLTTQPVNVKVGREKGSTTKSFVLFEPKTGSSGLFVKIPLTGASCPIALEEGYEVKGTVYGEATNPLGKAATTQPVTFSETIQKTAGGSLLFGKEPAYLTGQAIFSLGGSFFSVK